MEADSGDNRDEGHPKRLGASTKRMLLFFAVWLCILAFGVYRERRSNFEQRLIDLGCIRAALQAYNGDHGGYPLGWGSSSIGPGGKRYPEWIPGLIPRYIASIPNDPREISAPNRQYLYFSDGRGFKIIAHGVEDATYAAKVRPDLIDPRRRAYAYGFWTPTASNW
jgi:hypothetical protein